MPLLLKLRRTSALQPPSPPARRPAPSRRTLPVAADIKISKPRQLRHWHCGTSAIQPNCLRRQLQRRLSV
eukprot:1460896-Rhodomonas_salina.4